ncbi:DUF2461 family protein [Embleya hyalina]|uniref:TIGR02453 family protein n=1 Tax=Embleya hyalina TaxID=516124 RepID=A0A401Z2K0_9ACTN|nr:DUF2461 family protein [Embleya hyalina]GCE00998.1 TIGR02453 family protein [Embleya hyalina]
MREPFGGWTEQAFDVLLRLEGEPSTAERERHRGDRERLVRRPMIALLCDIADANPALENFSVWGFRKELWWWQHQGAVIRIARNVEISLRLDLDGFRVAGGWYYPDPGRVPLFRHAVADEESGPRLADALSRLGEQGYTTDGDLMTRMPRGYDATHPRASLLRHRSLRAARMVGTEQDLHSASLVDVVLDAAAELGPFLGWFARHVSGPAIEDRDATRVASEVPRG